MHAHSSTKFDATNLDEFETIEELIKNNPDKFTKSQLRWALRFRETNGLDTAVIKLGRTLYIHKPTLVYWMARQ